MGFREYFNGILKGVLSSVVITVLLTAILSLLMMFISFSDSVFNICYVVITCLGIVAGAIMSARTIGENGWLSGLLVGCIYYLVLLCVTFLFGGDISLGLYDLYRFVITLVIGVLSGMLGINIINE